MMKESFVFYLSFYEALREVEPEVRLNVYDALAEYALRGQECQLTGAASAIFKLMRPQIDANQRRYECGKKGGRPSSTKNQTVTKPKPTETKAEPNDNVNDNANGNVNVLNDIHTTEKEEEAVRVHETLARHNGDIKRCAENLYFDKYCGTDDSSFPQFLDLFIDFPASVVKSAVLRSMAYTVHDPLAYVRAACEQLVAERDTG